MLESIHPNRLLVIGSAVPLAMSACQKCRILGVADVQLPTGTYVFRIEDEAWLLHVEDGATPLLPYRTSWADAEDAMVQPYGWFLSWWPDAVDVAPPSFVSGDEVLLVPSGQEGTVRKVTSVGRSWSYEVRVPGRTVTVNQDGLSPFIVDTDPADWVARDPAPAERFSATLTRAKLRERLTDTVFSFRASRTVFRPYQFRPIIRLLATGQLRLLIADEVGLGKTIEAGLVWTEFDARNMANRVLVVCPASLVAKWRMEMRERFDFDLVELTSDRLDDLLEQVEEERLPTRLHAVCSLERLRAWEGLERLAELHPHFDLIIADEAHAFRNAETKSYALGSLLDDWSDALIFLTATPLNLGNDDLFNLLQLLDAENFSDRSQLEDRLLPNSILNRVSSSLLDPNVSNEDRRRWLDEVEPMTFGPAVVAQPEFGDLRRVLSYSALTPATVAEARRAISRLHALSAVVTRTRKADIQEEKAVREVKTIDVTWTDEERDFYVAFQEWQISRARYYSVPVGFITQMPLRLASSCLHMAKQQLLAGHWDLVSEEGGEEEEGRSVPDILLAPPSDLVTMAKALGDVDTKFDAFVPYLHEIVGQGKQVLVFTFSRPTLGYLERRLGPEFRVAVLHGDVDPDERHDVMRRFREGEFDVVVASRVASEGLDFEFCSAVVNYDLPWNPMEVEQRIGRIDRYGQAEEKILVVNFSMPGTIETDMVARLMTRIGVFEDSIGALEPILQEHLAGVRRILDFSLTEEERTRELERFLAAVEESKLARSEVEDAASFLSSTDGKEIDGLEMDLLRSGRYVGQAELQLLLQDWAEVNTGAGYMGFSDGAQFVLRGTAEMERQLMSVRGRGERSESEIDRLAAKLRDEVDIVLQLDPETARRTGGDLLTSNHPLVRAALGVPGHVQSRFAGIRVPGLAINRSFLVLLAVASWEGVRRSVELWAEPVPLDDGDPIGEIGDLLLSGLAEGSLADGPVPVSHERLLEGLQRTERQLLVHWERESERRTAENEALVEVRRISLSETHHKKVERIERTISTLRDRDKENMIGLQQAQLRTQGREFRRKSAELDDRIQGSLSLERIAVCVVTGGSDRG